MEKKHCSTILMKIHWFASFYSYSEIFLIKLPQHVGAISDVAWTLQMWDNMVRTFMISCCSVVVRTAFDQSQYTIQNCPVRQFSFACFQTFLKIIVTGVLSSSSRAIPKLERSGFHEVLPMFSILSVFPCWVEAKVKRLEICFQGA